MGKEKKEDQYKEGVSESNYPDCDSPITEKDQIKESGTSERTCPYCDSLIPNDAKFCLNCGRDIEAWNITECTKEKGEVVMFCAQCGKELSAGQKFCGYCGSAISDEVSTKLALREELSAIDKQAEIESKRDKRKSAAIIAAVLGVMLAIILIAALASKTPPEPYTSENGTIYHPLSDLISAYKRNPITAQGMWLYFEDKTVVNMYEGWLHVGTSEDTYSIKLGDESGVSIWAWMDINSYMSDFISELATSDKVSVRGQVTKIETDSNNKICGVTVEIYYIQNRTTLDAVFRVGGY